MKAQRLKIIEKGMTTFSDYYCGVKFTDGLSDDPVAPSIAAQIGSYIRVEGVDDGSQVGEARKYETGKKSKAPVVKPLAVETPETIAPDAAAKIETKTTYTKADLEAIADKDGIAGLRALAETFGVKGRGIVELITEILKAQG